MDIIIIIVIIIIVIYSLYMQNVPRGTFFLSSFLCDEDDLSHRMDLYINIGIALYIAYIYVIYGIYIKYGISCTRNAFDKIMSK